MAHIALCGRRGKRHMVRERNGWYVQKYIATMAEKGLHYYLLRCIYFFISVQSASLSTVQYHLSIEF